MAKPKQDYEAPKTMKLEGDGLEKKSVQHFFERAERVTKKNAAKHPDKKIGDIISGTDRPDTFSVLVPKNAAGLTLWLKSVDATAGKENAGMNQLLQSLETSIVKQKSNARKEADEEKQTLPDGELLPNFSGVRTVDESEAMGAQIAAGLKAGTINMADLAKLFGGAVK